MAYEVIQQFIPASKYPIKATHAMSPQWITLHNTYNDASAANEIAYMTRNNAYTSYHVAIDDMQAIQAIPFNRNAWHCGDGQGDGNRKSIGIEICYSKNGGERYTKAEANAIDYVAKLLKKYGWTVDRVKWHRDWSGKKCPHRIIDEGRLQQVKNRIEQRLKELNGVVQVANKNEEHERNAKPSPTLSKEFAEAVELGITDGTYPTRPATRQETAVMILRAMKKM